MEIRAQSLLLLQGSIFYKEYMADMFFAQIILQSK